MDVTGPASHATARFEPPVSSPRGRGLVEALEGLDLRFPGSPDDLTGVTVV